MSDPQPQRQLLASAVDSYPAVVRTLPIEYRTANAAALLEIGIELRKSFDAELAYVDQVIEVDAANLDAVRAVRKDLARRRRRRDISSARTHCGHIDDIARTLRSPYEARHEVAGLERFNDTLDPLRFADAEFLLDIEGILDRALAAVAVMEAHLEEGDDADAREMQERFDDEIGAEEAHIRDMLTRMSELTNELIKLQ